jgi:hypothetical protein
VAVAHPVEGLTKGRGVDESREAWCRLAEPVTSGIPQERPRSKRSGDSGREGQSSRVAR